jgi:ABC-type phosphate/phosphonate transport system substrate-binding protein
MMKKMFAFVVLAFLAVPFASFAQSPSSPEKSIENLSVTDIPEDSIVVLSKDGTDIPGYIHEKWGYFVILTFALGILAYLS